MDRETLDFEVRPQDEDGWFVARCEYADSTFYCQERTYSRLASSCSELARSLAKQHKSGPLTIRWTFNSSYTIHPTTKEFYSLWANGKQTKNCEAHANNMGSAKKSFSKTYPT
jgi:hypothetical protein